MWKGIGVKSALIWWLVSASIVFWWAFIRRPFGIGTSPIFTELGYTFFVFTNFSFMLFLIIDVIGLTLWCFRKTKINVKYEVLSVFVLAVALSCYGFYEGKNIRTVEITIPTYKLPMDTDVIRIAQISDLHIGRSFDPKQLIRAMELVDAAKPDIIVLTGDMVDMDLREDDYYYKILGSVEAPLGRFAVTGNHEYYAGFDQSVDFMKRAGYKVLHSDWHDLGPLVIAGIDNPGRAMFSRNNDGFNLLSSLPSEMRSKFVLFLKHLPYVHEDYVGLFDLQLSGHTHGGQIWPLRYVVNYLNGTKHGLSVYEDSLLYINNGTGLWGPPIRFLTPPEVTVINVVRKQQS
jgi:predicted MPP superfamily phosphohydrolase